MTGLITHAIAAGVGCGVGILIGVILTLWATKEEYGEDDATGAGIPQYSPYKDYDETE